MKRRLHLLTIVLVFIAWIQTFAQPHNNNWYFGTNAGLNFSTDPPTALVGSLSTNEGAATISDQQGNLLFYTGGTIIFDSRHLPMPNGTGLDGGWSSSQAAAIVPQPNSCSKYFVFTAQDQTNPGRLSYSVVDMNLNGGYGDVIPGQKNIALLDSIGEHVTAIAHANGIDSWIITHKQGTNNFYAYLVTATGISLPVISSAGTVHGVGGFDPNWMIGPIWPSHDGSKLVIAITFELLCEMFDFDKATGLVSNPLNLQQYFDDNRIYGIEFSPNDSLLYLGSASYPDTANYLFQVSYKDPVPDVDTIFCTPGGVEEFGALQLANNGKIYMARAGSTYISGIEKPNLRGDACAFKDTLVLLLPETRSSYGLQNVAPYSFCRLPGLGPDQTVCGVDSLLLDVSLEASALCPFDYTWFNGHTGTSQWVVSSGTYWIESTSECQTRRDSVTIRFDSAFHTPLALTICAGESYEGYTVSGIYVDTLTSIGQCDSIRTIALDVIPAAVFEIENSICLGESFLSYTQTGIYRDTFTSFHGCDSVRILRLAVIDCNSIISWSMNDCVSVMSEGTHMDYTEFQPTYPMHFCGDVDAQYVYRIFPQKHSCTPGWAETPGMCVTTQANCEYVAGAPESVILEFNVEPDPDSTVHITRFQFYEKSPLQYDWINGPSGTNNRALRYGIRVLKNGVEIFRQTDIATNLDWNQQSFDFIDSALFRVASITNFRIELLPYCRINNGAVESVWDLDAFRVYAGCVPSLSKPIISGHVFDIAGNGLAGVRIDIAPDPDFQHAQSTLTDSNGHYTIDANERGGSYYLRAYNNSAPLQYISTADLVRLQKHLLGIERFNTLDKYIAADVSHNNQLNVLDLLDIKKLLLGYFVNYPNNTSWRYGAWPFELHSSDFNTFSEFHFLESVQGNVTGIDFLGIKVGNVSGN